MRLIDADVLLDKTVRRNSAWNSITNSEGKNLEEIVSELPSVNPQEPTDTWSIKDIADTFKKHGLIVEQESKTGHWKRISIDLYVQHATAYYKCSECGEKVIGKHNYCPNCGVKMESEDDNT